MKKGFQDQFRNMHRIIRSNAETLKQLVQQSESLSCIIAKLGDDEEDAALRNQLEDLNKSITNAIDKLIEQTSNLFDAYTHLVDDVFGKN